MKLLRFRVSDFRSVTDSGWIETDGITALIGTNESGKTNLLLALWKLNPAREGEINAIADYPRKRYNEIRAMEDKPVFITAEFELPDDVATTVGAMTQVPVDEVRVARISRDFDGNYDVQFPKERARPSIPKSELSEMLRAAAEDIRQLSATKSEESLKTTMIERLDEATHSLEDHDDQLDLVAVESVRDLLAVDVSSATKRSTISPRFGQLTDGIEERVAALKKPAPSQHSGAIDLVVSKLLKFVYYSNYGNLDSEIYLPHVLENLKRLDLGAKEAAKARTLRVLFEFVRLQPDEIMELGEERRPSNRDLTDEEIAATAEKKKERDILLQSASTMLTDKFRDWWKQGEYRFRFQADGNFFRIWVSDDRRPEDIELDGRSAGLQWFLSFYLIFLVESDEGHKGSMLLLDEPGHSLHPLAQQDLSDFFENLASTNQLAYTTHSPFLVDPDHLDRVNAVYVDDRGATAVSANLRAGEHNSAQTQSIYPVHAALGLSVSSILLQGCEVVIVEGQSDQFYATVMKQHLIARGMITPPRELVFVPAGGTRGVGAIAAMVTGKDEKLPFVIHDADANGLSMVKQLASGLYVGSPDRLLNVGDLVQIERVEMEDLIPPSILAVVVTRYLRGQQDKDFTDVVVHDKPIVPQIEGYADAYGITLQKGWKVEIASRTKQFLLRNPDSMKDQEKYLKKWESLFTKLIAS